MSNDNLRVGVIGASPISVGRYTYGFENITIKQWNEGAALEIGSFCSIARDIVIFLGGNHRTDWVTTFPFGHVYKDELGDKKFMGHPSTKGDVLIGHDVWIGSGVTIMSGVKIGDGAVLSANACCVKDVHPYHIVAGNPSCSIKQRFDDEIIELLLDLKWWNFPIPIIRNITEKLCSRPDKNLLIELISLHRK
jgi:acetyltransferase-like isoleucine patch superfamily enzyme